jgi:hypothetical protein
MTRLYDEVSTQYNECLRVIREAGLIISAYWDYGGSDMYCWKWQWYDSDVVHTGYASRAEALIAALQSLIHERDSSPG